MEIDPQTKGREEKRRGEKKDRQDRVQRQDTFNTGEGQGKGQGQGLGKGKGQGLGQGKGQDKGQGKGQGQQQRCDDRRRGRAEAETWDEIEESGGTKEGKGCKRALFIAISD